MPQTRRPIVVGESNPYSDDPRDALSPAFPGSSGYRLWLMTGLSPETYASLLDRRNLCRRLWDDPTAVATAKSLRQSLTRGDRVVLLGHKVRRAMGVPNVRSMVEDGVRFYCVPHPSGLCRAYNRAQTRRRVGALLVRLAHGG